MPVKWLFARCESREHLSPWGLRQADAEEPEEPPDALGLGLSVVEVADWWFPGPSLAACRKIHFCSRSEQN